MTKTIKSRLNKIDDFSKIVQLNVVDDRCLLKILSGS